MLSTMACWGQDIPVKKKIVPTKTIQPQDTSTVKKSAERPLKKEQDSTTSDSIPAKKERLTDIIKYTAKDYTAFDSKKQQFYLYNEAEIDYGDMNIKAGSITINYSTNEVYAKGIIDTAGAYIQAPVFEKGTQVIEPDSILFNTETKKALIYHSVTQQSDGTVIANVTKRVNDSVYFIKDAKYTTAEDLDDPEYYIKLRKAKVVPGKKIVTGLANLFFYDVPTPLGLPFGFFPQSEKHTSGIIIPSFGEQNDRGYFLQNAGYYFAISDYFDLAVYGDYYTNGSYGFRLENNYAVRYKFRGSLSFRHENLITSERGFPDYGNNRLYNLRWSHSQDSKSSPNSRFSASVNLGSSTYYRNSLNQINTGNFLTNTLASSVSYSKSFRGEPEVNLSLTATHQQNTNTKQIRMSLPSFRGSVGRIYPLAPKTGTKKGIIQNINLQYSISGDNNITTTDSLFFKKEMFDNAKAGFQHSIPLSTNFKVFKYLSLSAGSSYNEVWTFNTIKKRYDPETEEIVTEDVNGFDRFNTYNFSTSLGTTLYGMFNFEKEGENRKIKAIRHVIRPSIGYSINPAFDKYYDTVEVINADGQTIEEQSYTRFENNLFGTPGRNFSSAMRLSLANNLEAKVRSKDTTAVEPEKVILLNNLNFSTSYNFAGDSLRWSPVRMTGSTQILKRKMSINFGATLDPYALDNNNNRIDKFNIDNNGSLFRLTAANLTMSYGFSSKDGKKDTDTKNDRPEDVLPKNLDLANNQIGSPPEKRTKEKPSELYNYKIPWSLRLAYSVNYNNRRRENEISSHSLMFSGDVTLSPKWSMGASSGYDLKNAGFTFTQLRFERDLLSWRMSFSWVPFSTRKSWNFFIGIKSSILKDLKYEKRRQPDQQL